MFPNTPLLQPLNSQRGFLLPLALFIIVVMSVLALTISRTATQTQSAAVQELISLQSFYAAESGAQRGMKALFFDVNNNRQAADAVCANMNLSPSYSGVAGLSTCTVTVSCSCRYRNGNDCAPATTTNYTPAPAIDVLTSFYTITSIAACGQHEYRAERTIQAGAYMEQE
ncbi:pilus assembly PilX N-terminal domain-containing protein [Cellvibrio sp. PSBB023]|uniref:pilus assembly PilX N-terminal domain-containing protein n=1 Tax=Cellvibrio sp. PSBB023 TaxID=1945512 RepID=UPI00098F2951|nr:pilus assembly PilX N-terminal domain-containing protein [Cellvibrio sp. PSBB023]AQT59089.1 MSHA biogenesis protein MshP [Cellvibrio sp. PSBB023]